MPGLEQSVANLKDDLAALKDIEARYVADVHDRIVGPAQRKLAEAEKHQASLVIRHVKRNNFAAAKAAADDLLEERYLFYNRDVKRAVRTLQTKFPDFPIPPAFMADAALPSIPRIPAMVTAPIRAPLLPLAKRFSTMSAQSQPATRATFPPAPLQGNLTVILGTPIPHSPILDSDHDEDALLSPLPSLKRSKAVAGLSDPDPQKRTCRYVSSYPLVLSFGRHGLMNYSVSKDWKAPLVAY